MKILDADSSKIFILSIAVFSILRHTYLYASTDLYLGQEPPGKSPKVFAPGIVSTTGQETDVTFTPDLKEIYFTRTGANWYSVIFVVKYRDGAWSDPEELSFATETSKNYPFVSPDGLSLFFDSNGETNAPGDRDLWVAGRDEEIWKEPIRIGKSVNTSAVESFAGASLSGAIFFCSRREGGVGQMDIYRAGRGRQGYDTPNNLGAAVNSEYNDFHPFVDPGERYLVFDSQRPGGLGANDLYVSYRNPDGTWAPASNLGTEINSPHADMRPYVSPDGKYLFFCSTRGGNQDIYWVEADSAGLK